MKKIVKIEHGLVYFTDGSFMSVEQLIHLYNNLISFLEAMKEGGTN